MKVYYPRFLNQKATMYGVELREIYISVIAGIILGNLFKIQSIYIISLSLLVQVVGRIFLSEGSFSFFFKSYNFLNLTENKKENTKVYLYQLELIDREQLSVAEKRDYFTSFVESIRLLKDVGQKIWFLDNKVFYLTSDENPSFHEITFNRDIDDFHQNFFGVCDVSGDPIVTSEHVFYDDLYYAFVRVTDFKQHLFENELSGSGDYFFIFKPIDSLKAKSKLELGRRLTSSTSGQQLRDFKEENSFDENQSLLSSVIQGDEDLFETQLWFVIRSFDTNQLEALIKRKIEYLSLSGFQVIREAIGNANAFYNFLPFESPDFAIKKIVQSSFISCLFPISSCYLHKRGTHFKSNIGKDIYFDLFNKNANFYNAIISGPPGAGKSFFCCRLIHWNYSQGVKVIVLDRGGSYLKLAKYLDGTLLKDFFNPLLFKNPTYLIELISSAIPQGEKTQVWRGDLFCEISKLDLELINTFDELVDHLPVRFQDIHFYFSEIKSSFSTKTLDNFKFGYIDLEKIPDRALSPFLVFIIEYVDRMQGKKVLVMDECHDLLKNNADFVLLRFREFRKHNGAAIALTQSLKDFYSSSIGRVIADCSWYNFIFNQPVSPNEYIDAEDCERIGSVATVKGQYSEVYLRTPHNRKAIRYFPEKLDYQLYTSSAEDNYAIEEYFKDKGRGNYQELFHQWIEACENHNI